MDPDRIFLRHRTGLVELSRRYRRPPPPPPPPPAASQPPPARPRVLSAPSLASLACLCVCRHFDRVDSLLGLTDDLGRLLFDAAMAQGLFQSQTASRCIRIFAEAFGDTFAAQLNLSGMDFQAHPAWPLAVPHLKAVTALALDGCHLDAIEDSLLASVGRLPGLRRLSLRHNCLLDSSLRTLTAPWRFRRERCAIQFLDLRGNKYITDKGLDHLLEISSLKEAIFSASADLERNLPLARCSNLRWRISRRSRDALRIDTSGWIGEVVAAWRRDGFYGSGEEPETETGAVLVLQRAVEFGSSSAFNSSRKKRRLNATEVADLALH